VGDAQARVRVPDERRQRLAVLGGRFAGAPGEGSVGLGVERLDVRAQALERVDRHAAGTVAQVHDDGGRVGQVHRVGQGRDVALGGVGRPVLTDLVPGDQVRRLLADPVRYLLPKVGVERLAGGLPELDPVVLRRVVEAVMATPTSADSQATARPTVGVAASPRSTTSVPDSRRPAASASVRNSPDSRGSPGRRRRCLRRRRPLVRPRARATR